MGDERELVRYEADSIHESAELAQNDLRDKLLDDCHAVLVIDGYATADGGTRTDALIVELLGPGGRSLGKVVQRYQAARRSRIPFVGRASGFAILGAPIISEEVEVPDAERVVLDSAREHPKAARLFRP